jgi:DNA-binding transcriptional LysR family regulator
MHRITIKQLAVFTAVAKDSSVTQAAQRIGLSQAAVSQALAELEHMLDRALFDRVGRKLVLNIEGKSLLPQALDLLDRVSAIEAPEYNQPFSLRLGASLTVGNHHLVPYVSRFLVEKPQGQIHVDIGNSESVTRALCHFDIDAGFIESDSAHPELITLPWQEDPLVIVAAPLHPLARRQEIGPKELEEANWILRERGSGTRDVFEHATLPHFQARNVRLELGGNVAIIQAVLLGVGLGCVSKVTVMNELANGRLVALPVPWLNLQRMLSVVIHRNKFMGKPLQAFFKTCGVSLEGLI